MTDINTELAQIQQYAAEGAGISALFAGLGIESQQTAATVQHVATIATDPTVPALIGELTTAHSAGGVGLFTAVLVAATHYFPNLLPGVQVVAATPAPSAPASVLATPTLL